MSTTGKTRPTDLPRLEGQVERKPREAASVVECSLGEVKTAPDHELDEHIGEKDRQVIDQDQSLKAPGREHQPRPSDVVEDPGVDAQPRHRQQPRPLRVAPAHPARRVAEMRDSRRHPASQPEGQECDQEDSAGRLQQAAEERTPRRPPARGDPSRRRSRAQSRGRSAWLAQLGPGRAGRSRRAHAASEAPTTMIETEKLIGVDSPLTDRLRGTTTRQVFFFGIVDHRRGRLAAGRGNRQHEEDRGMARSGGFGTLSLELLARQDRQGLVLGPGQEERVVAERAHAEVVAVDRLETIPHGVSPCGMAWSR